MSCICGGIDMGDDNWDLDVRSDCSVHGVPVTAPRLPEICCDTCSYTPTCEEMRDFLQDVLGLDDNGEPEP